jgi:hypothetical protein
MELVNQRLKCESLIHLSGFDPKGTIPTIKEKHYRIIKDVSVGGDAPKELLKLYEYSQGVKKANNPKQWDIFITKTGHKWYPNESITEHLLMCIGRCLGLSMAESRLYKINTQVRFLSKLFRNERDQILEHGAELYSGYLGDRDFVEEIEEKQMARHFFTVSFTNETIKYIYPHQYEDIFLDFSKMLVFDAIVGNNDRHFYNWAVVKHLRDKHQPKFSPIYDTARALFWNRSDEQLMRIMTDNSALEKMLNNYIFQSKPKVGVEKKPNANHFDVVKVLNSGRFYGTKDVVRDLVNDKNRSKVLELIKDEFGLLFCKERIQLICECLTLRFKELEKVIGK